MNECWVCGQEKGPDGKCYKKHFKLYEHWGWQWLRGNQKMFGFWKGTVSTIHIVFPFICTIRFWKYRKWQIKF